MTLRSGEVKFFMKIGVISDTHNQIELIKKALDVFKKQGVGMIIHAGDLDLASTLDEFKNARVPIKMVIGNIDEEPERFVERAEALGIDFEMNSFLNFEIDGKRLFVFHGNVLGKLDEVIKILGASKKYDVIIHGHTHVPRNERVGDVLVLNPGALKPMISGVKSSVVVYDVSEGKAEFIKF